MTKAKEIPTGQKKPDGTLTKQTENQTFIMQVFFNHESKETFQDKLLKIIFAEELTAPITHEIEPPKP